jgi:hypothetical protein
VLRLEATPRLPAKEDKEVSAKLAKQRGRFQESDDRDAFRQVIGELAMTKPTPPAAQTPAVPPAAPPAKAAELEQRSDSAQKNEVQDALRASHETITVEGESAAVPSVAESVAGKAKDADGERKKLQAEAAFGRNQGVLAKRHLADTREYGTLAQAGGKPVPRWTLSADGTLQRSLDGGRTWETILVPGKGVFRAVAAVESEIWVGGSAGALYHSADAGAHWVQVTPAMDGKTLTADIIGVEFADSLQGKLTTADHETWVTADGGQTWRK